jgi:hypothetical protein
VRVNTTSNGRRTPPLRENVPIVSPLPSSSQSHPFETPACARVAEVLSALYFALDLTEGQPHGHAVRSCVIGMHVAQEIGLPLEAQSDLYYACS